MVESKEAESHSLQEEHMVAALGKNWIWISQSVKIHFASCHVSWTNQMCIS